MPSPPFRSRQALDSSGEGEVVPSGGWGGGGCTFRRLGRGRLYLQEVGEELCEDACAFVQLLCVVYQVSNDLVGQGRTGDGRKGRKGGGGREEGEEGRRGIRGEG